MQVLLKKADSTHDIQCSICNQGFRLYWERTSPAERATMRAIVGAELRHQHTTDQTASAHPDAPFNMPDWAGPPQYSGAALLGGHTGLHRTVRSSR
ncbi:hypothetical protein [Edaphobacter bradus]|uniref:hypothetical protein n=1 Tax=Edaphobacter bradus TaxID=2259016 RepID=UPI0021DFDA07|nr:hypothetical protein [Edaphobacter bradus]